MRDEGCFVQFIHSGGEHKPDIGRIKKWNPIDHKHKRKFMRQAGKCTADPKDPKVEEGEIMFWGEWEPESTAQEIDNPINHGPRYIYEP